MEQFDNRVDAYIEKAAPFAKPVLIYLRQIAHEASPLLTETIKWGFPFFEYNGPVCQMAAFKKHMAFGFWKARLLNDPDHALKFGDAKAGSVGAITNIEDLPPKEVLIKLIQQAVALNENDIKLPVKKAPAEKKAETAPPDYFTDFLLNHPEATANFEKLSPSHKREYIQWITDAKTDATRLKRMETAVEWISEGKSRNWKYK
jgi:uncharacterized protein YdeI (YjbR/CyaY-like superfamily)